MSMLSALLAVINIISKVTTYLYDRNLIDKGGLASVQRVLQEKSDDLKKILAEISAADARFDTSGGVPDDIEYRPDSPGSTSGKG